VPQLNVGQVNPEAASGAGAEGKVGAGSYRLKGSVRVEEPFGFKSDELLDEVQLQRDPGSCEDMYDRGVLEVLTNLSGTGKTELSR